MNATTWLEVAHVQPVRSRDGPNEPEHGVTPSCGQIDATWSHVRPVVSYSCRHSLPAGSVTSAPTGVATASARTKRNVHSVARIPLRVDIPASSTGALPPGVLRRWRTFGSS